MNIKAVMAVLDEWTLDHTAKHALLCVACRADKRTWVAEVSIPRIAADMSVHYQTAADALHRLTEWGNLQPVDNVPGRTSRWLVDPATLTRGVPRELSGVTPRTGTPNPASLGRVVGVVGEVQGGADAPPNLNGRASTPVENSNSKTALRHGADLWEWLPDGTVRRRP